MIAQSSGSYEYILYPNLFPREDYLLRKTVFGSATGLQLQVVDLQEVLGLLR